MSELGYFIDIERFVKWLYDNSNYVGDDVNCIIQSSTYKNWRRYEKFPTDRHLEDINNLITNPGEKFEKINIADLLICVNNAIDINKGQKLQTITSTGKKVFTLLLLGRILDGKNKNGIFTTSEEKDPEVWSYLNQINKNIKFNGNGNSISLFYYFPGRTVSVSQLKTVKNNYRNGIKDTGITVGLKALLEANLVSCVDKEKELYKLNFIGCKKFLQDNK